MQIDCPKWGVAHPWFKIIRIKKHFVVVVLMDGWFDAGYTMSACSTVLRNAKCWSDCAVRRDSSQRIRATHAITAHTALRRYVPGWSLSGSQSHVQPHTNRCPSSHEQTHCTRGWSSYQSVFVRYCTSQNQIKLCELDINQKIGNFYNQRRKAFFHSMPEIFLGLLSFSNVLMNSTTTALNEIEKYIFTMSAVYTGYIDNHVFSCVSDGNYALLGSALIGQACHKQHVS